MAHNDHTAPLWVRAFTTGGRPTVAIIVMLMCAPGEHHLGHLAGWDSNLAWGMAAVLAAYAGIATVVASNRPKDAPGKRSAVWGAWISLAAAMMAQPVSHLFVTGWLSASPRAPWLLVIAVSCAPPLALGHLLHLAATPLRHTAEQADTPAEQHVDSPVAHLVDTAREVEQPVTHPALPAAAPATVALLTTSEVMEQLGVSRATLNRWKNNGRLTPVTRDPNTGNLYHPEQLTPGA